MDIGESIKQLNETHPYWPVIATGVGALVGYVVGRIHGSSKPKDDFHSLLQPQEIQQESTILEKKRDEDYQSRSICDAVRSCDDSQIKGTIKEFHNSLTGYSGVIVDSSGEVPFYFDEENIETGREEGLVPILLNRSRDTQTPIEMEGKFDSDTKVFKVEWLRYKMNNADYEI